jgi:hypothetical protein
VVGMFHGVFLRTQWKAKSFRGMASRGNMPSSRQPSWLDVYHLICFTWFILVTGFNGGNRNLTRKIAIVSMILAEYMYGIFVKPAQKVYR